MDQLKQQFAVAVRYGFWILTAVLLIGSAVLWYLSTSNLTAQHNTRASKIKSDLTAVTNIRNGLATHPNESSHDEMQSLIDGRKDEVLESWRQLFESQRDILVWPQSFTKDFLDQFENKIPIEVHFQYEPEKLDPTETTLRVQYSDYIKNELPKIAELAGAEWTAPFGVTNDEINFGSAGRMSQPTDAISVGGLRDGPLVQWSSASQSSLLADVFPWRGTDPSTLEICYSQENLWVLRELMEIIGSVNQGAKQSYQADIHEIKRLSIGRSVGFKVGKIDPPGSARLGGAGFEDFDLEMDMDMEMEMGMEGDFSSLVKLDPADLRYVDTARVPIDGAALRAAITSNLPSDVNLAVAKRIPVMMSLKMNQKAIPELLATCGSVPLKVEVQQVRILEPDASANVQNSGGGRGNDFDTDDFEELDEDMGMGGFNGQVQAKPRVEFPLDVTVEVYGLIFIYNPPNLEALGVDSITAETELSDGPEIVVDEAKMAAKAAAAAAAEAKTGPEAVEGDNPDLTTPAAADEATPPAGDGSAPETSTPPADTQPSQPQPGQQPTPNGPATNESASADIDPVGLPRPDSNSIFQRSIAVGQLAG